MSIRSLAPAACLAALVMFASPVQAQDAQARLWDAAIAGDTVAIVRAIGDGAKVDSLDIRRSVNGRRALNWAAIGNHVPALRVLLANGASINATNITGFTAVHHAAETGSVDALKFLIAAGADITIPNAEGSFPVDTARDRGNVEATQILVAAQKEN